MTEAFVFILVGYVCGISPSGAWLLQASSKSKRAPKGAFAQHVWTVLMMFNVFAVGVGSTAVITGVLKIGSSASSTAGVFIGVALGIATCLTLLYLVDDLPGREEVE